MSIRAFAIVGTVLVAIGLLSTMFDIPARLSRTTLTVLLVGGGVCLAVSLVLDERQRGDAA